MEVDPVFQEFADVLSGAAVAHAMALSGIRRMHEYWTDRLVNARPPTTSSSVVNISTGDPRVPGSLTYSKWRLGDLPAQLAEAGPVMVQIGHQWAVSVYAEWEEHYRARITTAIGAATPIQLPVFGDLRRFRHDVVHHRGIASKDNSGRCEVFRHWFAPGDVLYFDTAKVAEFMARLELAWAQPTAGWSDPERIRASATTIRLPDA